MTTVSQSFSALGDRARRRGLITTLTTSFLMNAGFFLIIPLLSVHYVDKLGWAAGYIGLVLALRQFLQQGLTVFGGALADRLGAKGLIMAGLLIRSVSFVLMGYATTPPLLMLSGVLAALGGALFDAPSTAAVASLANVSELPAYYARNGVLGNIARTLGPVIGAVLIHYDFVVVGIVAAAFFLLAFFVVWLSLPAVQVATEKQEMGKGLKMAACDRPFLAFTMLLMGYWFMWVQLSIAMPLVVKDITASDSSVALLFTVNSVFAIVLQAPALLLAQRYLSSMAIVISGVLLMAVGLGIVAGAASLLQIYVALFFFALGTVLVIPSVQTVVASLANPAARGSYFGLSALSLAIGGGLGHVAGGLLMDWADALQLPALPWIVFASVGGLTAVGLAAFSGRQRARIRQAQTATAPT
jgi:DHA1 family multidrug resistance protein-like MFS transporter